MLIINTLLGLFTIGILVIRLLVGLLGRRWLLWWLFGSILGVLRLSGIDLEVAAVVKHLHLLLDNWSEVIVEENSTCVGTQVPIVAIKRYSDEFGELLIFIIVLWQLVYKFKIRRIKLGNVNLLTFKVHDELNTDCI